MARWHPWGCKRTTVPLRCCGISLYHHDAALEGMGPFPPTTLCSMLPAHSPGLDVYEHEPAMAPGLADLPNAVIVPHIASASMWTRSGMVRGLHS